MAIRLSIGARRSQLVRQLLTESVLVSLLGGLLGLILAFWITNLMVALMPSFFVPNEARIEVNQYVLCFCLIVSVLTGILFGLAPALQCSCPNLVDALKDDSRASSAWRGGRIRGGLVIAEVALAVVLLVSAGLTVRSFVALQKVELGFRPERVMVAGFINAVQRELRAVDPTVAIEHVKTFEQIRSDSVAPQTFAMRLLIGFSLVGTALALVGIYSVLSLLVSSRQREIAIRMAVGAQRGSIVSLILRKGVRVVAVGLVCGVGAAFLLARVLEALLFGVQPTDTVTFAFAVVLLSVAAVLACFIPARRAARLDPMQALREE